MTSRTLLAFGYGSLVNRRTRPAGEHYFPARLRGWRRSWSHRIARRDDRGGSTSLNVYPTGESPSTAVDGIDGVVAAVPLDAVPMLDAREAGYHRLMLPATDFDLPPGTDAEAIAVYVSMDQNTWPATDSFPILQSYVDVVMAGFRDVFGAEGLGHFMSTTDGWHLPFDHDRAAPRYSRSHQLPSEIHAHFDSLLSPRRASA